MCSNFRANNDPACPQLQARTDGRTNGRLQDQGSNRQVPDAPGAVETPKLSLSPIGLRAANEFIDRVHRHHDPVTGHKFSVAVTDQENVIRGVGIAGRPKSRHLDRAGYLEVVRVATDGTKNACSMLYGALRRAGIALGYQPSQIITYTLMSEGGASLRAAGWGVDQISAGGSWSRDGRPREDRHPLEPKVRWVAFRPEVQRFVDEEARA